ncbi:DUF6801 domain-containing protein [Streptomyces klenkii]|uniref:DUF6801 domain-containing protein n=1 Tax=Streptomyces klenkii TaxID=1420899 RepID=UPI0030CF4A5E
MTSGQSTRRPGTRIALGVTAALGAAIGTLGVSGAGTASAQPVSLTLKYTCKVPVIDDQPFKAKIDADIPGSVAVGEPSRKFAIDARTTVDADLTPKLHLFGVKTVEGRVDAEIGVTAPQDDRRLKVPLDIPRTSVPESGSFDVKAAGDAPSLTFRRPGKARITVGDITMHVTGRKANGDILGKPLTVPCTLDSHQGNSIGSFEITGTGTTTGSTTSGTSGTGTTGSTASGGTSGMSASGGTSGATATGGKSDAGSAGGSKAPPSSTATGAIASTGQNAKDLIFPAVGALVAGVAAVYFGLRLKNRRR